MAQRSWLGWAIVFCAVAEAPRASAQTPIGGEFQINTYTNAQQSFAATAPAGTGFVVVWQSLVQDGSNAGVFGRRFDSSANPIGVEFQVNVRTTGYQNRPRAAGRNDGGFVVVWQSDGNQDGSLRGIFGRRFDSAGLAIGGEFQVNSYTPNNQNYPDIDMTGSGEFAVVWQSQLQDGDGYGVFGRSFDAAGTPLASEFQINDITADNQRTPNVSLVAGGAGPVSSRGIPKPRDLGLSFKTAWIDEAGEGRVQKIVVIDAAGVPATSPTPLSPGPDRDNGRCAFSDTGQGLCTFDYPGAGFDYEVACRSVQVNQLELELLGTEFEFPSTGVNFGADVASLCSECSEFGVAWPRNSSSVRLSVFDADTGTATAPIQVNQGSFTMTAVCIDRTCRECNPQAPGTQSSRAGLPQPGMAAPQFVVVWQSNYQDGSSFGIFGRRFALAAPPTGTPTTTPTPSVTPMATPTPTTTPGGTVIDDIDGDGQTDPLTDGLLKLRWMFGFRGATLILGAIDTQNCTRCTADDIEDYLASIEDALDIDGNGQTKALTDGILNLRWLFGFRDASLVVGAVDTQNCTRCTDDEIEDYIESLN